MYKQLTNLPTQRKAMTPMADRELASEIQWAKTRPQAEVGGINWIAVIAYIGIPAVFWSSAALLVLDFIK